MSGGRLSDVLAAVEGGATTRAEVARRCGLAPEVAEVALEQLVRLGRVRPLPLLSACPSGGCGSCATACVAPGSEPARH